MDTAPGKTGRQLALDYRRDIDGLRAVAVIAVLLFHAGIVPFGGGYVGVDVFFVISGYLITSIIVSQLEAGRFTLAEFYERRARRILPALFIVALTCLPVAWFCLLPSDMVGFSRSLLAVLALGSNLYFWRTSGYFDASAELSPMVHTWSLAVEEQFYLIFPALAALAWRLGRPRLWWLLVATAVLSLAVAQWASGHRPAANFYLLPTRAWELLLGAVCSLRRGETLAVMKARGGKVAAEALSATGGLLIAYAIVAFDAYTPNPSICTALPVFGTALLLLFAPGTTLGVVLGHKVLVGIGLISYSTYLWHQPLYAFARHLSLAPPSKWLLALLAVAAGMLGYLTWRLVEMPFRDRQRVDRNTFLAACACSVIGLATFAAAAHWSLGYETRLSVAERQVMAYAQYPHAAIYREGTCFLRSDQAPTEFKPDCSPGVMEHASIVWGDSHAAALSFGLRRVIPGVVQYTASGCPPVSNFEGITNRHCHDVNHFVLDQIDRIKPGRVFLHANWNQYRRNLPAAQMRQTIDAIRQRSPATRITLVGAVPQWYTSLPSSMLRTGTSLKDDQYLWSPFADELRAEDRLFEASAKAAGVEFFSARQALCRGNDCQATTRYEGALTLTAWDYGHFTAGGSVLLAGKLAHTINSDR